MSVVENHRPGRPTASTNDDHVGRVHPVVRGNRRLTVREVADEVGISIGYCHLIFTGNSDASQQFKIRAAFFD
jgi:hypothetical protein